jgi:hypothetical protein
MAFNQPQQKYYVPTWGTSSGFGQTVPLGTTSTTANNQTTNRFAPSNQSVAPWNKPLFGFSSTNSSLGASKQPLFSSLGASKQPLFGSSSTSLTSWNKPLNQYNVASNVTLIPLNLPRNKIEGLIFMVSLDQQNTLLSTEKLIDNMFNPTKFSSYNLWFTSLIKYSDEKFYLQKVEENHITFTLLYSSLLRELMLESIRTPQQLYKWLIDFAKTHKNKKMLWLFTILKFAEKNQIQDILDGTNEIEVFVWSLQTFVQYDDNPSVVVDLALQSTNHLYKTFLLSLVGASYGKEFYPSVKNEKLHELVAKFK